MAPILAGAAVCPPLQPELAHETIDANRVFGRALLALYRREVLAVPARDLDENLREAATRATSLHEFEATVTTPRFGYPSYEVFTEMERPSAALPRIRVPTLLLMAGDDPLVPAASLDGIDWSECPAVAPVLVRGRRALRLLRPRAGKPVRPRHRRLLRGRGGRGGRGGGGGRFGGSGRGRRARVAGRRSGRRLTVRTPAAASAPSARCRARHPPGSPRR